MLCNGKKFKGHTVTVFLLGTSKRDERTNPSAGTVRVSGFVGCSQQQEVVAFVLKHGQHKPKGKINFFAPDPEKEDCPPIISVTLKQFGQLEYLAYDTQHAQGKRGKNGSRRAVANFTSPAAAAKAVAFSQYPKLGGSKLEVKYSHAVSLRPLNRPWQRAEDDTAEIDEAVILNLIQTRDAARADRDYPRADGIQALLEEDWSVQLDSFLRKWWVGEPRNVLERGGLAAVACGSSPPTSLPTDAARTVAPEIEALTAAVKTTKDANPEMGVSRVCQAVRDANPTWQVFQRCVREVINRAEIEVLTAAVKTVKDANQEMDVSTVHKAVVDANPRWQVSKSSVRAVISAQKAYTFIAKQKEAKQKTAAALAKQRAGNKAAPKNTKPVAI